MCFLAYTYAQVASTGRTQNTSGRSGNRRRPHMISHSPPQLLSNDTPMPLPLTISSWVRVAGGVVPEPECARTGLIGALTLDNCRTIIAETPWEACRTIIGVTSEESAPDLIDSLDVD